ncbi:hypothetical protein HC022_11160 [Salipiger sp. HF18]|uniref:hypothetical protein n=1 Tax=Salipiger TaxID=263377 RepID=UPI00104202A5|nr:MULTISPECIES: hypothetical protein [Salipiger]NIY96778.1 hypothetical protein [Salipiger sp. HF18]
MKRSQHPIEQLYRSDDQRSEWADREQQDQHQPEDEPVVDRRVLVTGTAFAAPEAEFVTTVFAVEVSLLIEPHSGRAPVLWLPKNHKTRHEPLAA